MNCKNCHTQNPNSAKYCMACGAELHTGEASQPSAPKTATKPKSQLAISLGSTGTVATLVFTIIEIICLFGKWFNAGFMGDLSIFDISKMWSNLEDISSAFGGTSNPAVGIIFIGLCTFFIIAAIIYIILGIQLLIGKKCYKHYMYISAVLSTVLTLFIAYLLYSGHNAVFNIGNLINASMYGACISAIILLFISSHEFVKDKGDDSDFDDDVDDYVSDDVPDENTEREIICPHCNKELFVTSEFSLTECPYCGYKFY